MLPGNSASTNKTKIKSNHLKEAIDAIGHLSGKDLKAIQRVVGSAIEAREKEGLDGGGQRQGQGGLDEDVVWSMVCEISMERNGPRIPKKIEHAARGARKDSLLADVRVAIEEIKNSMPDGLTKQQQFAFAKLMVKLAWITLERTYEDWVPTPDRGVGYMLKNLSSFVSSHYPGYYQTPLWQRQMMATIHGNGVVR